MNRVVHFEMAADDPDRAKKFYEKVFGWKIEKWNGPMDYWMVMTGKEKPGIDGGLMKRADSKHLASGATVNTVSVESVDDFVGRIKKNGGSIVMEKSAIPGVGWFAYCKDTEGNLFGIMQDDKAAK